MWNVTNLTHFLTNETGENDSEWFQVIPIWECDQPNVTWVRTRTQAIMAEKGFSHFAAKRLARLCTLHEIFST